MSWVKLDDGFPEHPKVLEAGPLASWLHVRAIAYCNRQLTDGFVSHAAVRHMNGVKSTATLVRVGLWEQVKGGFQIHDYLVYQPSREEVVARRDQWRQQRSAAGRARAAQASRDHGRFAPADDQRRTSEVAGIPLVASTSDSPAPSRSRPVPVPHHVSDAYQAPDPEIPDDPEPGRGSERAIGRGGMTHVGEVIARLAR